MNPRLFPSQRGGFAAPQADTANEAGGLAYQLSPEAALAQMAATCTFGNAYYSSAEQQLEIILKLTEKVSSEFVAKTAVYARQQAFTKDTPALLYCVLMARGDEGLQWTRKIFDHVIDNGRQLIGLTKILRSDVTGRHNFGHATRGMVSDLLGRVPPHVVFRWDIATDGTTLADVIKLARPKPPNAEKAALYGYITKSDKVIKENLPEIVKQYEAFKAYKLEGGEYAPVPPVPFQKISSLKLTPAEWAGCFRSGGWHFTRMNLATALRQQVLDDPELVDLIVSRLRDVEAIRKSRVYPYQLLVAYKRVADKVPGAIRNALHDALEVTVDNVPAIDGQLAVCVDTSGSMSGSISGYRPDGRTSKVACVDVAGLIAASLLRKNPDTVIVPFDTTVHQIHTDPRDSVMTNAQRLARNGGGTNCACALAHLNKSGHKGNLVIYVSDNQAWMETPASSLYGYGGRRTGMAEEWGVYKARNPNARLVNINIQPYDTSQMPEGQKDVYQVGGFSDHIYTLIADWLAGRNADHWVETIKAIDLDQKPARMQK
jgi:60 kDa SS-A/Ro ribonucleoprotein